MKEVKGIHGRILFINLSERKIEEIPIDPEDVRLYIGGKGLALKFVYDYMNPGVHPFNEKNILAFMTGPLNGTGAPSSSRFSAVTKSPLTGIFASSSCGGSFGIALKSAGYDGLLIQGKSETPVYIEIDENGVKFQDAFSLWGKETIETQKLLNVKRGDGALVIGPAGENKVLYANIASGHRFLGRAGFGAVMGSKNLKAIVVRKGGYKIVPVDEKTFQKIRKKANEYINRNHFTAVLYRNYGTNANINLCNKGRILPVFNFRYGSHEKAVEVSGETIKKKHRTTYSTCIPCSILCGHKGTYRGSVYQVPEYETNALFGPNLGIFDTEIIAEWNNICTEMGMDTISTASTIAYVMEATEKGLMKTELKFGSPEGISEILRDIAYRRGIGDELANGTRWLSEKYGGKEFALHVKGLEIPAYDPRGSWGQGLAYAVANRGGCHVSATLFPLEVFFGFLNPYTTRAKPEFVKFFENLYCVINSLGTCIFTAFAYVLETPLIRYIPDFLLGFAMQNMSRIAIQFIDVSIYRKFFEAVTGIKMSQRELLKAGERVHVLERYMNVREGISKKDDTLPPRFLKEGRGDDPQNRTVPLEKMIKKYYKLRGYDSNGIPRPETLKKLGIPLKETKEGKVG